MVVERVRLTGVGEIREVKVRGKVMPMIEAVCMIQISLVQERVSPSAKNDSGPSTVSGGLRYKGTKAERDVHDVAERAEEKECTSAENRKTKRPRAHQRSDKVESPPGSRSCLGSDGCHTAHTVDDRIDFPMGADTQHHGGRVPSVMEHIIQSEEDEGAENGFGGSARGDAEYKWVQ